MDPVNQKQVGGTHYNQVTVQHWDLVTVNNLPYLEAQITKYVTRWKKKHGAQDVEKSIHYLEKLQDMLAKRQTRLPAPGKAGDFDLTSAGAPRPNPPLLLEEFANENKIGDIEKTIFFLLLTYTTDDELTRVGILLQHLLGAAKEIEATPVAVAAR